MFFLNEILGLDHRLLSPEQPQFLFWQKNDRNRISGTQKWRVLGSPNPAMSIVHDRLRNWIRDLSVEYSHTTAYLPGSSPKANVLRHCGSRFFYVTDISSAFAHVEIAALANVLCSLDNALVGYNNETEEFLRDHCFLPDGGLVTGGPASQDLFNLYCAVRLDPFIAEICKERQLDVYTRYGDDMVVSAKSHKISRRTRKQIRKAIHAAGFTTNNKKTHIWDINIRPVVITGIGLRADGRLFIPNSYVQDTEELLAQLTAGDETLASSIRGRISAIQAVLGRENPRVQKLYTTMNRAKFLPY